MMTIAQIMEKMIAFSEGNIHDITHLSCVWTYAKTIGELEGLDAETQFILEVAAITHDIACPLCRKKYGNTNGSYQEQEGDPLVREFLAVCGNCVLPPPMPAGSWGMSRSSLPTGSAAKPGRRAAFLAPLSALMRDRAKGWLLSQAGKRWCT